MAQSHLFQIIIIAHLMVLSLWGGVVATEAVIELLPFRQKDLHPATIRLHLWIDLLVELPLVIGVVVSGSLLLYLADSITQTHLVKVGFALAAVGVNLYCIVVVVIRARSLERADDEKRLWKASRTVLACFAAGLAAAGVAAVLGFRLGFARMG